MFLLSVATIWAVACITPGPNTLLVMRYALTAPRRVAIAAATGTVTGTFLWGLAGWLGINALFQAAPFAYQAPKIVGGLYLVWLGAKILRDVRKSGPAADLALPKIEISLKTAYRMGSPPTWPIRSRPCSSPRCLLRPCPRGRRSSTGWPRSLSWSASRHFIIPALSA